MRKSEAGLTLI